MKWPSYQRMRKIFHWQYSSFFICILVALSIGMWTYNKFAPARIFMILAGLYGGLYWQVSDFMAKKRGEWLNQRKSLSKRKTKSKEPGNSRLKHSYIVWDAVGCSLIAAVLLTLLVWIGHDQIDFELSQLHGRLYPANDSVPEGWCSPKDDMVTLWLGANAVMSGFFPLGIAEVANQPLIMLDRDKDGIIVLNVDVRSADGRIIARLDAGGFVVNQNNFLSMKRTDRSSIVLLDQNGDEVLSARYQNRNNFKLTAKLHSYGRVVDLSELHADLSGLMFSGQCIVVPHWKKGYFLFGVN